MSRCVWELGSEPIYMHCHITRQTLMRLRENGEKAGGGAGGRGDGAKGPVCLKAEIRAPLSDPLRREHVSRVASNCGTPASSGSAPCSGLIGEVCEALQKVRPHFRDSMLRCPKWHLSPDT